MIEILSEGDKWGFDEATQRLYKNDMVVPERDAIPVYSNSDKDALPEFSGIYVKATGCIISLSGNVNKIENVDV